MPDANAGHGTDQEEALTMGWGQLPSDARAAEEARQAALEQAAEADRRRAERPLSRFEAGVLEVLGEIRESLKASEPVALSAIPGAVELVSNGCCAGAGPATSLDPLLDSEPAVLARSVQAAGLALANAFPTLRDDFTAAGFEKFAEVAIEAALHEAARDRNAEADLLVDEVDRPKASSAAAPDEPAGGEPGPRGPAGGRP